MTRRSDKDKLKINKSGISRRFSNLIIEESTKAFPIVPTTDATANTVHSTIAWDSSRYSGIRVVGPDVEE